MQGLIHLYTTIGYPCTTLCAKTEEGLDGLRADLKDKLLCFPVIRVWVNLQLSIN